MPKVGYRFPKGPAEDRFWPKVDVKGPDDCWAWRGSRLTSASGCYGWFWGDGRPGLAHRFSWELHRGAIPDGLLVLHSCDNPPCVNPAHLFIGTDADNTHDMMAKGRAVFDGLRHGAIRSTSASTVHP